ncbi:hypothetical protein D3C84_1225150 [compost metagenome]
MRYSDKGIPKEKTIIEFMARRLYFCDPFIPPSAMLFNTIDIIITAIIDRLVLKFLV